MKSNIIEKILKKDSPLGDESLFFLAVLVIGLSGLVAQVLLLRELLISFYGNELTLGIILANWVILEAAGAFFLGSYIGRLRNKINTFVILQAAFSLLLPLSVYSARISKSLLGVPFGEAIGLSAVFYISFLVILPIAFCHGALFSVSCRIYSSPTKESAHSTGLVYAWETIGTMLGGIAFTYFLIPYLNSFQVVFIVSLTNLFICLLFLGNLSNRFKYIFLALFTLWLYLFLTGSAGRLHKASLARQFPAKEVLDYRNSVYGNIAVIKEKEQYTFFYNGMPTITTPYPDLTFVQEFGNLPLLFCPEPKDILIIGGGAGGLINEALKHPIKRIDYAELDPLLIRLLKKYHTPLTEKELGDRRVNIIYSDGRFFVRNTLNKYDLVLIGLSRPADLSLNRLFSQEFFSLAKQRLKPGGTLSFYLPGSLTFLSQQLKDLNACILNPLKNTYAYVRVIPGDYNIFLASDSKDVMEPDAKLLSKRINQRQIKTDILIPNYLDYRLSQKWVDWFERSLVGATKRINHDFTPFAVYQMLIIWNKQFSLLIADTLEFLKGISLVAIFIPILIMTILCMYLARAKVSGRRLSLGYAIATTGFFGMLTNLILIFTFQVVYGYLYYIIGLLVSVFMAGVAIGSMIITRRLAQIKNSLGLFIKIEGVILIFSLCLGLFLPGVGRHPLIFLLLFIFCGILLGLEFPLANKIYLEDKGIAGESAGKLYAADLLGGWAAGILGSVVFLPLLGLLKTCLVIAMLKLSSLVLLYFTRHQAG